VIEELFATGRTFSIYPLRVFYLIREVELKLDVIDAPLQFGVGVSKRHFKKAVHRNRVKRLLKETYRIQKAALLDEVVEKGASLQVFAIFTGKDLPQFEELKDKVAEALERLKKEVRKIK
jgi:ribonuclease P protein component